MPNKARLHCKEGEKLDLIIRYNEGPSVINNNRRIPIKRNQFEREGVPGRTLNIRNDPRY